MTADVSNKTIFSMGRGSGSGSRARVLVSVMVSGLVVTISAFLLLSTFVTQAITLDHEGQKNDLLQMVSGQVARVGQDVRAISAMLSVAEPQTLQNGQIVTMIAQNKELSDSLTAVFWMEGTEFNADQSLQLYPMEKSAGSALSGIIQRLRTNSWFQKVGEGTVILPLTQVWETTRTHVKHGQEQYRIISDYITLITPQKLGGVSGALVAIMPARALINEGWLRQKNHIGRLSLRDESNLRIYDYYPVHFSSDPDQTSEISAQDMVAPLADGAGGLQMVFTSTGAGRSSVLAFMPYVALVLGLMLTVFGSYYVHNNQSQSELLLKMNRTLALKNMEMNSQVIERERLNQILRKTERENRAIIDSVTDIIFELDEAGRFVFVNETWQKILEYPKERAEEIELFDLIHTDDSAKHLEEFQQFIQGLRDPFNMNARVKTAFNTYRMMEIKFSMRRMDESKNLRIIGTMTDIEERRRAEAALMEAEKRYRSIWENAPSGIYQVTVEGKLLSANPSLAKIFGYEGPEEMIADVVDMPRQLFPSFKDRSNIIRKLMQDGFLLNHESQAMRRDRRSFWLLETARVVKNENGDILYLEGSVDDVTQRKEAEIKLKDAMIQSDLANRSKTEFLANMSHELRTPLNAIIGFSEMIKDQVYGPIEHQQYKDYATDIHNSGKNLLSIINTILDVARIEAGERQLNETLIHVGTMVESVIDFVRPKVAANNQQIQFMISAGLPRLLGEEQAVRQILLNLLSNAIKFTPTGGQITVKAEIEPSGDLTIAISDTGVGLDADELARVMTPFGLASGNFARSSSGPGLGLTLVHSLTKLHGGRFDMISQKGVGTTAMVIFPSVRMKQG